MSQQTEHKTCNQCKQSLPCSEFYRVKRSDPNRLRNPCKTCHRGGQPPRPPGLSRREIGYRCKYGLTLAEYEKIYYSQGGRCAICNRRGGKRGLAVDHNHQSNIVRGLLCGECNMGLGRFRDNPILLSNATMYLLERGYDSSYQPGRAPGWIIAIAQKQRAQTA